MYIYIYIYTCIHVYIYIYIYIYYYLQRRRGRVAHDAEASDVEADALQLHEPAHIVNIFLLKRCEYSNYTTTTMRK